MASSARHSLSKDERLHGKKDISELLAKGKFRTNGSIRYCFRPDNGLTYSRMMVSVPKRLFRRAVRRNRIKRLVRESFRLQKHLLAGDSGVDVLFIYNSKETLPGSDVFATVGRIMKDICNETGKSQRPA